MMQGFSVKYGHSDILKAMLLAQKASGRNWVYIGVIALAVGVHYEEAIIEQPLYSLPLFAGFIFALVICFNGLQRMASSSAARRWMKGTLNRDLRRSFVVGEREMQMSNGQKEVSRPWENFDRLVESDDLVLLFYNRRSFEIIPKQQLGEEQLAKFLPFIRQKIKYSKSYVSNR